MCDLHLQMIGQVVSASLSREIQEFCSHWDDHLQYRKETHHVMLESMKEQKAKQKQQGKREHDEVFKQMTRNVEKVRATARDFLNGGASTILVEERHMAWTEADFLYIKEKMNKIKQKIKGLYLNWQAEYEEAMTTEQCEDIHRFYEPHVQKYETKYEMLYQTWKQAIGERKRVSSPRVSAPKLTPSLAALEDASTLKEKEWNRGKSHVETPHRYSTREGRLTPITPAYEDMRTATPFHGTTVESQEGLSATEGGEESEKVTQQPSDPIEESESRDVPPISVEYRPDGIEERIRQEDMSRKNEIPRESSREDALTTTNYFFNNVTERRSATEVPVTTMTGVSQPDTPPTTSASEIEHPEPSLVRTFPPSGTPPRPIATATLRPRMLEQRKSEGQVEEQSQDDDGSEDETIEPFVMEGLPDELRPEWRILHPFDIPGVRNPTEDTPPTHRRLAENDRFTDWSSIASPPATFPHGMPGKSTEPGENVPNQVNGPAAETTRSEGIDVGNVDRTTTALQTEPIGEDQDMHAGPTIHIDTGPQNNNLEQNEENVDIIPPVPIRSAQLSLHTDDLVLIDASQGASEENSVAKSSQVRSNTIEGISRICPVDSNITGGIRQSTLDERGRGQSYQSGGVQQPRTSTISDDSASDRFCGERGRPPERDRYPVRDRGR